MPQSPKIDSKDPKPTGGGPGTPAPAVDASPYAEALAAIRFNADGLVPAIAQADGTGEILMMAWMNREAALETLATGRVCYWSRSRGGLWRKGETSGQVQRLKDFRIDCDGDTLLLVVEQDGVACHTGRRSCFYRAWRDGRLEVIQEIETDPAILYGGHAGHSHD
ncbi:phosphoribosyl-AMP cyclohydrolase [Azospirillum picis]|uniref:Phosphoribosyl-AMP cyclohydrolase n=1 Tax=Azospirillum picis TaxID=488438 RepID=A0ABU0MHD1_9PROT|nr:phosphoribosyl-AMP cyclohydrolase [Azospirillum picis]MBP2298315.1 phosphoribosyl-AMP cyclohydrolase [Azospirillum picis]MDQ0532636.1 phosphoribosyl-AMP cyclohydrolase [Azospirillum picis]